MTFPTATLTANNVVLQPGVTYSLGSLLTFSDAENTGDPITDVSVGIERQTSYSLSGTFVPDGVPIPFYGYVIKGTIDTGNRPAWGSLSEGSLIVPTDYASSTLSLVGYYHLGFLNSAANNAPWTVSYAFSATFAVEAPLTISITGPAMSLEPDFG